MSEVIKDLIMIPKYIMTKLEKKDLMPLKGGDGWKLKFLIFSWTDKLQLSFANLILVKIAHISNVLYRQMKLFKFFLVHSHLSWWIIELTS